MESLPKLRQYVFDFKQGVVHNQSGNVCAPEEIAQSIAEKDPDHELGIGESTAMRAIITRSALEQSREIPGFTVDPQQNAYKRILYSQRESPIPPH